MRSNSWLEAAPFDRFTGEVSLWGVRSVDRAEKHLADYITGDDVR